LDGIRDEKKICCAAYPEFGHFVIRTEGLFAAIRCPAVVPPLRGHSHDDTLAIELTVNNNDVFIDPGTFVYTPLPEERNRYRTASAHSVPRPRGYPGIDLSRGLFDTGGLLEGQCLYFGPRGFVGQVIGPGWTVLRALVLNFNHVLLLDVCRDHELAPLEPLAKLPPVCWGYGRKTTRSPRAL
jgi:hypothetical protein